MFASARTAAGSPLASPTLMHVVEFAHTHSPLVGLGITMGAQVASGSVASSSMQIGHGSGQPIMRRPSLHRMQSPGSITPPCTPRLQSVAILPSAFSPPNILNAIGFQSPFLAEGYFSDDNVSLENREAIASGTQHTNIPQTTVRRIARTTNDRRSTLRSTLRNTYPEVERLGLGITGISLNQSSIISNVDANAFNGVLSPDVVDSSPEVQITYRMTITRTEPRPTTRLVGFNSRAHVIGSSNLSDLSLNDDADGYNADAENDGSRSRQRRRHGRRTVSAPGGISPCRARVLTPFYGPNGEATWL